MKKDTKIINFFGGPGIGKSTTASYVYSKLKMMGVDAEYVTEFAKDKVWENNAEVFKCNPYISGKQIFKISRCIGKVECIVTDAPILLGAIFEEENEFFKKSVLYEFNKHKDRNINILLTRSTAYNENGRNEKEEDAVKLDRKIKDILQENDIPYFECSTDENGYEELMHYLTHLDEYMMN